MPVRHQRPQIIESLRRALLIDAEGAGWPVSEDIQLTGPVFSSLDTTPYLRLFEPVAGTVVAAAGGAGVYGGVMFRPGRKADTGADSILQIERIRINNRGAAAVRFSLRMAAAATYAAGTIAGATAFVSLNSPYFALNRPERAHTITHTGELGTQFDSLTVPAGDSRVIELADSEISLWGNADPAGRPALIVWGTTDNVDVEATAYGRGWMLS